MIDRLRMLPVRLAMLAIVATGFTCGKDPVPPENKRPVAVGMIPDTTLLEGDVYTRNIAEFFEDPDDDALKYTALSSNATVAAASMSGATLTVRAVAEGTATVTITATDADGLSATQSFGVTVERPNQAPVVEEEIEDRTLTEGDTVIVDVSGNFSDPDGDALAFSAASDDTEVATVTVDGSDIAVVGVVPGSAFVSVTATDPGGLSVTEAFAVTVERRNRAPVAVGEVPPVTMFEGEVFVVPVSQFFEDPDDDELTYAAASSDTSVVTTAMSGDTITVTAVAPGMATITVTATDPDGLSATQTAEFTVEKVNRAPVIADTIPHQTLTEGDTIILDVSGNFSDPDGDTLVFTAESDDTTAVTVSVDGSEVTIVAVAVGSASVSVTASDPDSLAVTQVFDVAVQEPNQAPVPVGEIAEQSLVRGDTIMLDVSGNFIDPDGDTLIFMASSSDDAVVTADADGDTVTILGKGKGRATVTATDPGGLSATQEISVLAGAPRPVDEIADRALTRYDIVEIDVSDYFEDCRPG